MKPTESFFEKDKNSDKTLARLTQERTQLNKIRYERGEITTENLKDIK